MTDIFSNQPSSQEPELPTQIQNGVTPDTSTGWKKMLEDKKPILMSMFNKFYINKKVFWPVSIFLGLVVLIAVLGLLFGSKGGQRSVITTRVATPTPFVRATPKITPENGILFETQQILEDLKNQIRAFDVKQTKLQPPSINFDIKF